MATGLKQRPDEDQDRFNPAQRKGNDDFDQRASHEASNGNAARDEDGNVDLGKKEKNPALDWDDSKIDDEIANRSKGKAEQDQQDTRLGRPASGGDIQYSQGSGSQNRLQSGISRLKNAGKKKIAAVVVAAIVALGGGSIVSFFGNFAELIHIKEVITQEIGGVQGNVIRTRSGMLYSRMFFFREDGDFDGFKSRGKLTSVYENYRTENLLTDMRAEGFEVEFKKGPGGAFTGIVERIYDPNNPANTINTADEFASFWKKRGAIRSALRNRYPDQSILWRARQTQRFYARFGLVRGNWLSNTRIGQKIDEIEAQTRLNINERFKAYFRATIAGDASAGQFTVRPAITDEVDENGDPTSRAIGDIVGDQADDVRSTLLDDPTSRLEKASDIEVTKALTGSAKGAARGALLGATGIGAVSIACEIRAYMNTVEVGARTIRSSQLMKFASMILTQADGMKSHALSDEDTNLIMNYINREDPETGNNFFGTGSWDWASGGALGLGVLPDNFNNFSVGLSSGWAGALGGLNEAVRNIIGENGKTACEIATNPFVQIGAGIATIGIGILSGGTTLTIAASQAAVGAALSATAEVAKAVALPYLISMAAGMVVSGDEYGPGVAGALVSGSGVMFGQKGADVGMRPVSRQRAVAIHNDVQEEQRFAMSQRNFYDRYLNPLAANSAANIALVKRPTLKGIARSLPQKISSVFSPDYIKTLLGATPVMAQEEVERYSHCPEADIIQNEIATDPFCNPVFAESQEILENVDPVDVLGYMINNDVVDGDGNILDTAAGNQYRDYVELCFENPRVDVLRDEDNQPVDDCRIAGPDINMVSNGVNMELYDVFRIYRLDRSIGESIAQGINRDFESVSGGQATVQTPSNDTGLIKGDPRTTTETPGQEVLCDPPRTIDVGVHDAYASGVPFRVRMCAITNLPCPTSDECNGREGVVGANGTAVSSARVASAWYQLVEDANAAGHNLVAGSSFRTMNHQERLCYRSSTQGGRLCAQGNYRLVAKPGTSLHQLGTAIDFNNMSTTGGGTCATRATHNSEAWRWLRDNASRYGFRQYSVEAWHWDTGTGDNRC